VTAVEVRPGVHRLEELDGPRLLCQYVVEGSEKTLVVDAGLPGSPERGLLPLLSRLGGPVILVVTHPDADHCGGASVLRAELPDLEIVAGAADGALVGDPELTLAERYRVFEASDGIGLPPERLDAIRARLGAPFAVDRALESDTELDLGGRRAELLHVPGHSPGHLAVWLRAERVAIIGDAVMGSGIPRTDGSILYPPMYAPPSAYLSTIARLEALAPTLLLCGHESPLEGEEALAFIAKSRAAAERIETLVRVALVAGLSTLAQICADVAERYGVQTNDFAVTVHGILQELAP
jgi:glyoxylase-like metal-dependent hydrolase (beta-lactamase superfamily II)